MTQDMSKIKTKHREMDSEEFPLWKLFQTTFLLLLMMVMGATGAWGQTVSTGLYYIASKGKNYIYNPNSTANYYLCPTKDWYYYQSTSPYHFQHTDSPNNDNGMPFMTTYQCRNGVYDSKEALWVVKESSTAGWYHVIHLIDGKYLTYNSKMESGKEGRMRVHLEESPSDADVKLWSINWVSQSESYDIISKKVSNSYKYLNVNDGNKPYLYAYGGKTDGPNSMETGGIIGLWQYGAYYEPDQSKNDQNSQWKPESVLLTAPTISDLNKDNNTFTITDTNELPAGYTIRYTTGDGSQAAPTATTGEVYNSSVTISETCTVKAVVVRYGVVLTEVASKSLVPFTQCDAPTLAYNHNNKTVTITKTWPTDATIYYTLNASGTPDQAYTGPITIADNCDIVRAIVAKAGLDDSPVASISRVAAPTYVFDDATQNLTISCATEDATIHYTTDGETPTISSTEYSGAVTLTSGGTVKAIAVKDGYIYSNVVENTYTQTAAPTITFNQYTNTFTISAATGTTIHYTIDGNPPTTTSATYSTAESLTSAATIKALAVKSGEVYSSITTKVIGKSNTPVISYSGDDEITITTDPSGVEVRYTTDGTAPTKTSTLYSTPLTLTATQNVVKAIVYEADKVSSDVATLSTIVRMGSSYPYLIQSQENTNYYLQPCVMTENGFSNKTTTSSIARPIMQWYFTDAGTDNGKQYYYIVNQNNFADPAVQATEYLYYHTPTVNGTTYYMISRAPASDFVESDDKYKFTISAATGGGYNIFPKENENRCINKNGGNAQTWAAQASGDKTNARSRWNFLPAGDYTLPSAPIDVSTATDNDAYYYKIGSVSRADTYLVTGTDCVSSSTSTGEDRVWFVREAGNDGWNRYYHIINAETGKYLYLEKTTTWSTNSYTLKNASDVLPENAYRLEFLLPKSTTDNLYIVPNSLRDLNNQMQYYTGLALRENQDNPQTIPLRTDGTRQILWNFTTTTFTCASPVVTYDDVNNQIVISSTQGANVFYTINGGNNTLYEGPIDNTNTGSPKTIRAVCARRTDQTDASDAVTIVLNPTITLSDASIPYDGNNHQPGITSIMDGETTINSSEYTYSYKRNGVTVTNCKDAGEYTIVVTDVAGGDYFVYGTTTFTINKADISPNVSIEGWSYGDAASIPSVTGNLGEGTVTFQYKIQGAEDATYVSTIPTAAGNYTVRAIIAETDNYNSNSSATANFTITQKSLGSGPTPADGITVDIVTSGEDTYTATVTHNGRVLTEGSDYTLTVSTGTKYHNVTLTGSSPNYSGSFTTKYAIVAFGTNDNENYSGTFVSDNSDGDFITPTGMTAYKITGITGNTVNVTQLDCIPENEPVLLLSNAPANGFLVKAKSGGPTAVTGNELVVATGTETERTFKTAEVYLLYNGEFVLNMAGTLAEGKVYLRKPSGSSTAPARLGIIWDESTGIENIQKTTIDNQTSFEWYTLDGRHLNGKPSKKGLYLRSGEKMVVK